MLDLHGADAEGAAGCELPAFFLSELHKAEPSMRNLQGGDRACEEELGNCGKGAEGQLLVRVRLNAIVVVGLREPQLPSPASQPQQLQGRQVQSWCQ